MLTLYDGTTSVCAIKVRLVLAEKDIPFQSRTLDLRVGDQFDPDYLKLNPGAVVPTLVDGDTVVTESSIIMFYLEDKWPEPTLLPESPADRARLRHWMKRIDAPTHPDTGVLTHATAFRGSFLAKSPQEQEAHFAKMPDPARRERQRAVYAEGLDAPIVVGAVQRFDALLTDMEDALAASDWLAGPAYSLADAAATPYANRLDNLALFAVWRDRCPRVAAWFERIKARPSFDAAVTRYFTDKDAAHFSSVDPDAADRVRGILKAA